MFVPDSAFSKKIGPYFYRKIMTRPTLFLSRVCLHGKPRGKADGRLLTYSGTTTTRNDFLAQNKTLFSREFGSIPDFDFFDFDLNLPLIWLVRGAEAKDSGAFIHDHPNTITTSHLYLASPITLSNFPLHTPNASSLPPRSIIRSRNHYLPSTRLS